MAPVKTPAPPRQATLPSGDSPVPTLDDLLQLDPDEFVGRYTDIAAVNLACARGLLPIEEGEFPEYMALLDTIAEAVEQETERSRRLFKVKPAQFHHSDAVFRMYTMEHVFRRRFGIRYDDKVKETIEQGRRWNTSDSSEVFIHGILSKKRTGTCSSLPTFAIAVGRRLGYPLKLVLVPNHTFYRWDDGDEDFNYQHTEAGGDIHPNEYFHEWPVKWKYEDFRMNERTKVWLHSMSPKQETSKFLCNRAILLITTRRYDEALQAVDAARRFNPDNPACSSIREEIEFRQHNPGGLASLPLDVLSQVPLSRPEITLLEKLAPFLPAPGHSPDSQHLRSFMPTLRPLTQPLMPPQTGPQPCVAQPPFPESVSARQLIELTNHLRRLAVRNTQSQSVDIRASSPQPTQPPTMPPQPADLQTFVGTIGLNIEHTRFQ